VRQCFLLRLRLQLRL